MKTHIVNKKWYIVLILFLTLGIAGNIMMASTNTASAFMDECEDDVCLQTEAGYVCADYTQVPGSDPGNNCDVTTGGEDCNPTPCGEANPGGNWDKDKWCALLLRWGTSSFLI